MKIVAKKNVLLNNKSQKTIVFYQTEDDKKCRFFIENDKQLTARILENTKNHRVDVTSLSYAIKGIKEKLNSLLYQDGIQSKKTYDNPITALAEKCQKKYRKPITSMVLGKRGADHCPVITVCITLPDGRKYTASGYNQKVARQQAAERALSEL